MNRLLQEEREEMISRLNLHRQLFVPLLSMFHSLVSLVSTRPLTLFALDSMIAEKDDFFTDKEGQYG